MIIYKITYGDTSILFTGTEQEALLKANEVGGIYEKYSDGIRNPAEQKLKDQIDFGNLLWLEFLKDNRELGTITPAQSVTLDQTFSTLEKCCLRGDISTIEYLMPSVQTDDVIFTEARKQKYITMIQNFRANESSV